MAPLIAAPLRFHWKLSVAVGDHVPGFAVSVDPTDAVPLMVGVGAVPNVSVAMVFAAEVFAVVVYPVRLPVTVTVSFCPASAVASL
ncbi:hypothetical protein JOD63_001373 [Microbacterium terrae]|uniref:hypothetical protein n=1 Tax=Microbacterium terrae TaxID=69369 RepID=UPI001B3ABA52|nr:hypothetical protein [Microbacterium terrae]MBP1077405.1 hypothetical protein [Microbacterium terrae]